MRCHLRTVVLVGATFFLGQLVVVLFMSGRTAISGNHANPVTESQQLEETVPPMHDMTTAVSHTPSTEADEHKKLLDRRKEQLKIIAKPRDVEPTIAAGDTTAAVKYTCEFESHVIIAPQQDLYSISTTSADMCCAACNAEPRCRAFTFMDNGSRECYLKYSSQGRTPMKNRISGIRTAPIVATPPVPTLNVDSLIKQHALMAGDHLWKRDTTSSCESINNADALSALARAKTPQCRALLQHLSCLSQENRMYPPNVAPARDAACKGFAQAIPDMNNPRPARIAFMIAVNGRAVRHIKRLFFTMYREEHWYLFHVDAKSDYLFQELQTFLEPYKNAWVAQFRLATIWGSSNLYEMYMRGMEEMIDLEWDYFHNLSESDLPVKPIEELAEYLGKFRHQGLNFLKSHGGDFTKFVKKQGLDRTFVLCENHMWRIQPRELPADVNIQGGSDWFTLTHDYARFLLSNNSFVAGMRLFYDYSLLSAESFFHVILYNGPMCSTFYNSNLRLANWQRQYGCKCQQKEIVDWCGCSPMVFRSHEFDKLLPRDIFFARKFDPKICNSIVNRVESELLHITNDLNKAMYWENVYKHGFPTTDTSLMTYLHSFIRLATNKLESLASTVSCAPVFKGIIEAHAVFLNDKFYAYTVLFKTTQSSRVGHQFEVLVRPTSLAKVKVTDDTGLHLHNVLHGTMFDEKERVYRRFGGLVTVQDNFGIAPEYNRTTTEHPIVLKFSHGAEKREFAKTIAKDTDCINQPHGLAVVTEGAWNAAITTAEGKVLAQLYFPVSVVHATPDPNEEVDALIGKFWEIAEVCVDNDAADVCTGVDPCTTLTWSSLHPHSQPS